MGELPAVGSVWVRKKDGKRVVVEGAPNHRLGFVALRWPNGNATRKRYHYFRDEFEPAPPGEQDDGD